MPELFAVALKRPAADGALGPTQVGTTRLPETYSGELSVCSGTERPELRMAELSKPKMSQQSNALLETEV